MNDSIKLGDWGCGRSNSSEIYMDTNIGTIPYMSPELIAGKYNLKTDIWFV